MHLYIDKIVPTQRTSTLVAALEPPEETHRVEGVLAGSAPFVRCLHVRRDNRVTDGTFALALQSALYVPAECHQPILQVAVGEHDYSLDREQPILPFPLIHQHSTSPHDQSRLQWIGRRQ